MVENGKDFIGLNTGATGDDADSQRVRSVLTFNEVKRMHKGVYVCRARNKLGTDSERFEVDIEVSHEMKYIIAGVATLILFAFAALALVIRVNPVNRIIFKTPANFRFLCHA